MTAIATTEAGLQAMMIAAMDAEALRPAHAVGMMMTEMIAVPHVEGMMIVGIRRVPARTTRVADGVAILRDTPKPHGGAGKNATMASVRAGATKMTT